MKDALIVLLACLAVWVTGRDFFERRAHERTRHELAVMQTEKLEADAQAAGWRTRLVEAGSIGEQLQVAKAENALLLEDKRELLQQVETLGGQVRVLADMYADLSGQIETHEATVHVSDSSQAVPDSVTAPIDDGLLTGRMAFVPPSTLGLEYSAHLELVLGVSETADGRALLTARSPQERVQLNYGATYWNPPAAERYTPFWSKVWWFFLGSLGGAIGWEVAR